MQTLASLANEESEMKADDLHGLMRVNETKSIRLSAEVMANAAMARTESRTGSSHFRSDFPETNETDWKKFVLVSKNEDQMNINYSDASESLASAFDREK
jgi:succinate dehydrogenase/fumarate reductase flavoprotein subunit